VIRGHKFFEMQSALSATGQVTGPELLELERHVSQCPSCRNYMLDMTAMSRELFLTQGERWSSKTPPGMHDRFVKRAVADGIALRPASGPFTGLDFGFAGALTITVMFAALIALAWNFASVSRMERAAVTRRSGTASLSKDSLESTTQQSGLKAAYTALVSERRFQRRATIRGRSALKGFHVPNNTDGDPRSYAVQKMPLAAGQAMSTSALAGEVFWPDRPTPSYLTAGMRSASRSSSTRADMASLFELKWDGHPVEHSFRFDLTLASLSQPDSPFNPHATARVPSLKFSNPPFHINLGRSW
jgi:hypothetical protein